MLINEAQEVTIDSNRVKQIIINLISNAIKYTQKGFVKVISKIKDDQVSICVQDTGTGIEPTKLAQIFTAFTKIILNREFNLEGVGLGLTISRNLARAMGGDIKVKSRLRQGSKFTLVLPFNPHNRPPNDNSSESPFYRRGIASTHFRGANLLADNRPPERENQGGGGGLLNLNMPVQVDAEPSNASASHLDISEHTLQQNDFHLPLVSQISTPIADPQRFGSVQSRTLIQNRDEQSLIERMRLRAGLTPQRNSTVHNPIAGDPFESNQERQINRRLRHIRHYKFLIVDDEAMNLIALESMLNCLGVSQI